METEKNTVQFQGLNVWAVCKSSAETRMCESKLRGERVQAYTLGR